MSNLTMKRRDDGPHQMAQDISDPVQDTVIRPVRLTSVSGMLKNSLKTLLIKPDLGNNGKSSGKSSRG